MQRRGVNAVLTILVAMAFAMPLAARATAGNNSKATSATMDILMSVTLSGKQIQPGTYTITADDSTVTIAQGKKVLAQAPVQWKDETSKSKNSNIVTADNKITEIHFGGKMKYAAVME